MRARRKRAQVVVSLLPGSEMWVLVKHPKGHFKLPGTASALELVDLALAQAGTVPKEIRQSELLVRVPWSYLVELEGRAGVSSR